MSISYSAIILDKSSQQYLKDYFIDQIPENWEWIGHHMTITLNELPSNLKNDIGKRINLIADHIGESDKAIALKVEGYYSKNLIPHITLAVNLDNGGTPKDSNKITDWSYIEPIELSGVIEEVPNNTLTEYEQVSNGLITGSNNFADDARRNRINMDLPAQVHANMGIRENKISKKQLINEIITTFPQNVGTMNASLEGWIDSGVNKDGVELDYILEEEPDDEKEN